MSEHLPECPWTPATLLHNDHLCICDRLRAAEQRGPDKGKQSRIVADALDAAYAQGQRDALAGAVQRVLAKYEFAYDEEDDYDVDEPSYISAKTSEVIAAIKGDSDE
jgi:hypothetical protein